MTERAQSPLRRHFTLILIAVLGLISVGTFVVFTYFAREGIAARRQVSVKKLLGLGTSLHMYFDAYKALPDDASVLYPKYISDARFFVNPSWPEEAGYIYVAGVSPADSAETMLIFENVPPQKQKLGRLVLLHGPELKVMALTQSEFDAKLQAQETEWKKSGRQWRLVPIKPPAP